MNSFVDSNLSGINEDDCDIIPRVLPGNYCPHTERLRKSRLPYGFSLARSRDKSHIPCTPIRDMLINELKVLKYRSQRITGSFRFDMAVVEIQNQEMRQNYLKLMKLALMAWLDPPLFRKQFSVSPLNFAKISLPLIRPLPKLAICDALKIIGSLSIWGLQLGRRSSGLQSQKKLNLSWSSPLQFGCDQLSSTPLFRHELYR